MKIHREINSLEEWFEKAPPAKGQAQWKDGFSAKEFARLFFRENHPSMPKELTKFLKSNSIQLQNIVLFPEKKTILPASTRGPRNHDAVIIGNSGPQNVLIGIEAKVAESADDIISTRLMNAKPNSKFPERIETIAKLIRATDYNNIYYQYFSGLAGTIIEAANNGADVAVFLLCQLVPATNSSQFVLQHRKHFQDFIGSLSLSEHQGWSKALKPNFSELKNSNLRSTPITFIGYIEINI